MSSPKSVAFFVYDITTGVPVGGAFPSFTIYQDTDGTPLAQPAITDFGNGAYLFTPTFPTDKGILFTVQAAGFNPEFQSGYLRPEDYAVDRIEDLYHEHFGKWEIKTSGPDANRIVLYKTDGVTVLQKFDLFDSFGIPTYSNPFKREPV